jgi:hypothetical protein
MTRRRSSTWSVLTPFCSGVAAARRARDSMLGGDPQHGDVVGEEPLKTARILHGGGEFFQQTYRSHGVGLAPEHSRVVCQGYLHAAPPEIHEDPLAAREVDSAPHGKVNQARLFRARDDLQPDPRFAVDSLDQEVTVGRLPNRAGGHGSKVAHAQAVHLLPEAGEGSDRPVHGPGGEPAVEEDLVPQPDRRPLHDHRFV